MQNLPGMIPAFALPGEIRPGQFGPISLAPVSFTKRYTRVMSRTGTPSVIQIISGIPEAAASIIASAAKGGGT
jgi:hypothetical protein